MLLHWCLIKRDISIERKSAIYARYVHSETDSVYISFMGNKRWTALLLALKMPSVSFWNTKALAGQGDDYNRTVGLGTDGAAVMTRRQNGLEVKLKQLNNILIQVHCVAHRINFASKDFDYL